MSKKIIFTDRSDSLLDSYLRNISKYKILGTEEVIRLVGLAQQGDENARNKVIYSNLRFVITVAKQFQNRGVPLIDLISAGNLGIMKAIELFDPKKEVAFLTYAVWWIRQKIHNEIYWNGKEIRLPMSQQLQINKILTATNKLLQSTGRMPTPEEISETSGVSRKDIDFLSQYANKPVSVDDFIGGDEEHNQVCDIIPDNEPLLEDQVNRIFVREELEKYIDKLPIREQDVIRLLYGIGMPSVPHKDICTMFGVGSERVRQMKESALAKLRRRFSKQLKHLL